EPEMTVQVWITNVRITRKSRKPMNSDFVHSQAERPRVRSCCCAVAGRDCFDCDRLRFDVAMGPAVRGYGRQRPALQEDTLLSALCFGFGTGWGNGAPQALAYLATA